MKKQITIICIIALFLFVGLTGCFGEEGEKTIVIQELIDAAFPGDTINIPVGIYYEHITIDKPINLIGEDKNNTIIESDWINDTVYVCANNVTISEFTIKNGLIGVHLSSCHNTTITNNIISNNADLNKYVDLTGIQLKLPLWPTVAGIYLRESKGNLIHNNIIIDNVGSSIVLCLNSDSNYISDNIITNNSHGIYSYSSCSNTITNNNISRNTYYGIIALEDSENNRVFNNNLLGNTQNAYDECNNTWDNLIMEMSGTQYAKGNYWSDYEKQYPNAVQSPIIDIDGNEYVIWGLQYNITGGNNKDRYPLVNPVDI